MGIGLRVGIELVAALVVAVAIGYGLDWLFGTRPILTAVFVLSAARQACGMCGVCSRHD